VVYLKKIGDYSSIHSDTDCTEGSVVYSLSPALVNKEKTRTSIQVGENRHVEDQMGMYINHSCHPSCVIDGMNVVAIKNIKVGEEITFDYACEGELASPFTCNCCGNYIDGKELLSERR